MVLAIIQARLGSSRLPEKVLLPFGPSHTTLSYMIERVKKAKLVDQVVVATTSKPDDKKLIDYLESIGQKYFAGSENDVLDRYYQTAKAYCQSPSDVIIRLTGDCPFSDPVIIDLAVKTYQSGDYDFVSNSLEPYSYPDGLDVEVFSFANLERAAREAKLPSHREHVTFYFWQNPELFRVYYCQYPKKLSHYRLTLDYLQDYELLTKIREHFEEKNTSDFHMEEIVEFMESHPEIAKLNADKKQNAGWQTALEEDKKYLNN